MVYATDLQNSISFEKAHRGTDRQLCNNNGWSKNNSRFLFSYLFQSLRMNDSLNSIAHFCIFTQILNKFVD